MTTKVRVGIVDKQSLFRDGMILALSSQPDVEVACQGASIGDALRMGFESKLDILMLDMKTLEDSLDAVEAVIQQSPWIKVLIFAPAADEEHVHAAFKSGVRGYLLKEAVAAELIQAVRVINQGQIYISPSLAAKLLMCSGSRTARETKKRIASASHTPRGADPGYPERRPQQQGNRQQARSQRENDQAPSHQHPAQAEGSQSSGSRPSCIELPAGDISGIPT
jgi:DNA-binding NarL/FixJ family response regulator